MAPIAARSVVGNFIIILDLHKKYSYIILLRISLEIINLSKMAPIAARSVVGNFIIILDLHKKYSYVYNIVFINDIIIIITST